jgi:thymidylate kinase
MIPQIYFITGVCGSGKSAVGKALKEILLPSEFDVHDLDERGVPGKEGRKWRLNEIKYFIELGNRNAEYGITTIISGFARPSEIRELAPDQNNIVCVLLDAQPEIIKERLNGRYSTSESREKFYLKHQKSVEQFVDENCVFLPTLRKECEEYNCPVIITDEKSIKVVTEEVVAIIKKEIWNTK